MVCMSTTNCAFALRSMSERVCECCYCCWFTPPLPWDGGIARTAIQVHAINLIELGQGKSGSPFRTSRGCKLPIGSLTTNKADCHWWVPKSRLLRHAG